MDPGVLISVASVEHRLLTTYLGRLGIQRWQTLPGVKLLMAPFLVSHKRMRNQNLITTFNYALNRHNTS